MLSAKSHTLREFDSAVELDDRLDRVREDFPILQQSVHDQPLAYLDNAASAQKPRAVIERIERFYEQEYSNVHRGVHALSQTATDAYESARNTVRRFIGAGSEQEIVFTRGTTEALNLIAHSYAGPRLQPGDEILLSMMEHHSNIVPWQLVGERTGAVLKVIPIDADGSLQYGTFQHLLGDRTRLVAIAHMSNSLGTINPVREMIRDAHAANVPVVVDGAQAVPHMRVDVRELDCDFYAFSAHKMFGPTGIGVLYGKQGLLEEMEPYQSGGDMIESVSFECTTFNRLPHKFEAGTPHTAGAIGLSAAVEYIEGVGYDFIQAHESRLLAYADHRLSEIDGLRFIGRAPERAGVISFLLGDAHPYDVATILDRFGIAVRSGHHCTQPLMDHLQIPGTVRASFALYNTLEEVDRLCDALKRAASMLL